MEIDIQEFYNKETKQYKNYNIDIARGVVDNDVINSFINGNIVKFIFFDKQYADISSDDTINEIHKFKSKYRGNTYVRIPISFLKEDGNDYVRGIIIDENTKNYLIARRAFGFATEEYDDCYNMSGEEIKELEDKVCAL